MSTALLDAVVKKNRARLIPFMLALYVLAFLDRSNIGFAKQAFSLWYMRFWGFRRIF